MTKFFTDHRTGEVLAHVRVEDGAVNLEAHDYGISDGNGRKVGGLLRTYVETYVDDETANSLVRPGLVGQSLFCVELFTTRNGRKFGATPRTMKFQTSVEAHAHANKAIARAKARALKVHAS